jgi:hypothetical protein
VIALPLSLPFIDLLNGCICVPKEMTDFTHVYFTTIKSEPEISRMKKMNMLIEHS